MEHKHWRVAYSQTIPPPHLISSTVDAFRCSHTATNWFTPVTVEYEWWMRVSKIPTSSSNDCATVFGRRYKKRTWLMHEACTGDVVFELWVILWESQNNQRSGMNEGNSIWLPSSKVLNVLEMILMISLLRWWLDACFVSIGMTFRLWA